MRLELEYTHGLSVTSNIYYDSICGANTNTCNIKVHSFRLRANLITFWVLYMFFSDQPNVRCVFYLHIWGSCLSAKQTLKLIVFYCVRGGVWCLWCGFFHRFLVFGSYDVAPRNPIKLGHFMWQPKIKFSVWMYFPWNHVNSRPFSRTAALVETTLKATRIWIP